MQKIDTTDSPARGSGAVRIIGCLSVLATVALAAVGCRNSGPAKQWEDELEMPGSLGLQDQDFPITEREAWFSFFDDDELRLLVQQALESNPGLNAARARVTQAEARVDLAEASFWPTLSASIEALRTRAPLGQGLPSDIGGGGGGGGEVMTFDTYRASLAASYEVDIWNRLSDQSRAAVFARDAAASALQSVGITVAANLTEAWLDTLLSKQRLHVLDEQAEVSKDLLELTEWRLANGQGSALEVSRQDQQYASVLELIEREQAQLEASKARLAQLVGEAPQEANIDLERDDFPKLPAVPEPGLPGSLLYRRPDLQQSLNQLRGEDARAAALLAERFPALQLQASLFGESRDWQSLFDDLFYRIAVSLSEELFDGGREQARIAEQEALVEERLYSLRETLLSALGEVAITGAQYAQQRKALALMYQQLDSAREATRLANLEFVRGEVPYIQTLDTLRSLQQLELGVLNAERQLLALHVQLCRALGGAWPEELAVEVGKERS